LIISSSADDRAAYERVDRIRAEVVKISV